MTLYLVNILLGDKVIDTYELEADSPEDAGDNCLEQTREDLTVEVVPQAEEEA